MNMQNTTPYTQQLYHYKMQVVKDETIFYNSSDFKITKPTDAYEILKTTYSLDDILIQEKFQVLFLNNSNTVIGTYTLSKGGMTGTVADIRLLMRSAVLSGATAIILSHNHPSGKLTASDSDIQITKKIKEAGKVLDIEILDHLIITEDNYFSFSSEGIL